MSTDVLTQVDPGVMPPLDWQQPPLSKVAEIRFSGVNKVSQPSEDPVRLCNYVDVYKNDYITAGMDFMHATATRTEIEQFGLRVGDVIITKDSETPDDIGVPAVVDSTAPDIVCGYHLALIRPNQEEVDSSFLAKQIGHHRLLRYFGRQANGSTRYGLSTASIARAPLWQPEDRDEQVEIGRILRLIDAAISKSEAVIAKLKQVRTGLVHDLLTRGLDDNGQLRDPLTHPDRFKESPAGRIPMTWEAVPVEQAGDVRLGRQRSPAHEIGQFMKPYLRVANVFDGFIDYSDILTMNFNPYEQKIYGLREGDILLNEGQSLELVGRSAIFRGLAGAYCFQNTLVRFRCNESTIPVYCQAMFKYWLDTRRFTLIAKQTTSVAHLGADRFAKMPFPRPPVPEQEEIAKLLALDSEAIDCEERACAKLRVLKSGLTDDLLTGRVRVPEVETT